LSIPSRTQRWQCCVKLPRAMESSPASPVPAGRSVLRAVLAKTRALFGLRLIIAAVAGFLLRRLLQQRKASGLGWLLLDRLGLLRPGCVQDTTVKSSNLPSFARSLHLPPAEDTDGIEEPPHEKVQKTSARSSTYASSKQDSTPERSETWHPCAASEPQEEREHKRPGAEQQTMRGTLPPLPLMSSEIGSPASGLASRLPALRSLTIKLLEPAVAKDDARFYWANAQRAKAAKLFTLVDLTSAATVKQVKECVAVEAGISPARLQLLLFGCKLQDARTLHSYGLDNVSDPLIHVLPLNAAPA